MISNLFSIFSMHVWFTGKTRTKDKYRVVYTDYQRCELEKEYHMGHYITIRRKSELAQVLQLSERQVKIWFVTFYWHNFSDSNKKWLDLMNKHH